MLTDAHCHPFDLAKLDASSEAQRRGGVLCAASSWNVEQFEYHEKICRDFPLVPCFAVHPQLPAAAACGREKAALIREGLELLERLVSEKRPGAVGETGFDLYGAAMKETEKIQDGLFEEHLSAALRGDLPLVLHVRRAMHKVFAHASRLKKCRAVIFHSWPGTVGEGEALLRRGINAYFSFGTSVLLNHKEAMLSCASFPSERLLAETDAPYQSPRGRPFSSWADLPGILAAIAALRSGAGKKEASPEIITEENFRRAFEGAFTLPPDHKEK
ncbi:MAG: TatD family hydrolase [Treponema sp.]|jgi:TatD DNase family protein|nr:TatD family hydrolase [Treponema sp.]